MHGVQALLRGLHLLKIVAESEPEGIGLSEAAELASVSRPTAHRLLGALLSENFIDQPAARGPYRLGREMATLFQPDHHRIDWHTMTDDVMQQLAAEIQDVVLFAIRAGNRTLVISRMEGEFPVRTHVVKAGDRHPPGVGTAWIAMMARMPDEEIDMLLGEDQRRRVDFPRFNDALVRRLISQARSVGYALNQGLIFKGAWAMGVPVLDASERPIAAISVAAIADRLATERRSQLLPRLTEAAGLIAERVRKAA